jgi:hypothetical protein
LLRGRWVFYGPLGRRGKTRPGTARRHFLGNVPPAGVSLTTMRRHVSKRIRRMAGSKNVKETKGGSFTFEAATRDRSGAAGAAVGVAWRGDMRWLA